MVQIIVSVITSMASLIGVLLTIRAENKRTEETVKKQSDLTLYRLTELEKKQDKHNTLIERMYKAEQSIQVIETKLSLMQSNLDSHNHESM